VQGGIIRFKFTEWNSVGAGLYNDIATENVVEIIPGNPILSPIRNEASTFTTQISVEMPDITSGTLSAGGVIIFSYNL